MGDAKQLGGWNLADFIPRLSVVALARRVGPTCPTLVLAEPDFLLLKVSGGMKHLCFDQRASGFDLVLQRLTLSLGPTSISAASCVLRTEEAKIEIWTFEVETDGFQMVRNIKAQKVWLSRRSWWTRTCCTEPSRDAGLTGPTGWNPSKHPDSRGQAS